MVTFIGGAVNTLLSERQVTQWLKKEIKNYSLPLAIDFTQANLTFFDGLWPSLRLSIDNLKTISTNHCKYPFNLDIQSVSAPLLFTPLFQGKIKFGTVEVIDGTLSFLEKECEPNGAHEVVVEEKLSAGASPQLLPLSVVAVPKDKILKASEWLTALEIQNIEVTGATWYPYNQKLLALNAQLNGEKIILNALVVPFKQWTDLAGDAPIDLDIEADAQNLKAKIAMRVREGVAEFSGHLDLATQILNVTSELQDVPMPSVVAGLRWLNVIDMHLNPRQMWLTAKTQLTGELKKWRELVLEASQLRLVANDGVVEVPSLSLQMLNGQIAKYPVRASLKNISIGEVLATLDRKGYTGIFSNLGQLSGELNVNAADSASFSGEINDLEIKFSRLNLQAKQVVKAIKGELNWRGSEIAGVIKECEFEDGQYKGVVNFEFDHQFLQGHFAVDVSELMFEADVQQVMLAGKTSPIIIHGQGEFADGQVREWQGDLLLNEIKGQDWMAKDIIFKTKFGQKKMSVTAKAGAIQLSTGNVLLKTMQPALRLINKNIQEINLAKFSVNGSVEGGLVKWKQGSASLPAYKSKLLSNGQWSEELGFDSKLSCSGSCQSQKWQIIGSWPDLNVLTLKR